MISLTSRKIICIGLIYRPLKLLTLFFRALILAGLFTARFTAPYDYLLLLELYPRLWYERILVLEMGNSIQKINNISVHL